MNAEEAKLKEWIGGIQGINAAATAAARERLDSLIKPPGSLGGLEDIAAQLAGITGEVYNSVEKRCVVILCADNGVVEEGVASAPQSVTFEQTINFMRGVTGVAVLAKQFGAELMVVDVGVNADIKNPKVVDRKIRKGTWNLAKSPAMTREEAVRALLIGVEMAKKAKDEGYKLIGVGEMGIGNTTTSSAVLCALTGAEVEPVVGKGAGLGENGFARKKRLIQDALGRLRPDPSDPVDVLSKVGGFDIAAMAGVYLGAAYYKLPAVVDGFISIVAALAAARLQPLAVGYMIASHGSYEPGYAYAAKQLGLKPALTLNMRLGEGSGCPLMFAVIDGACAVIKNMATFAESGIGGDYLESVKGEDKFAVAAAEKEP